MERKNIIIIILCFLVLGGIVLFLLSYFNLIHLNSPNSISNYVNSPSGCCANPGDDVYNPPTPMSCCDGSSPVADSKGVMRCKSSDPVSVITLPNVIVIDKSGWNVYDSNGKVIKENFTSNVQNGIDSLFNTMTNAEFTINRYALLIMPGTYNIKLNVGFYTTCIGLGINPDDTTVDNINVDEYNGFSLNNFWRSSENIKVNNRSNGNNSLAYWAVSQGAPLDNMHFTGDVKFSKDGYSSGGFMGNSQVDGTCYNGSQQQWISMGSNFSNWNDSRWNQVALGCNGNIQGNPQDSAKLGEANLIIDNIPQACNKPYLVYTNNAYQIIVPKVKTSVKGYTKNLDYNIINDFYVANATTDNATTINNALSIGKSILLTPGIYKLDKSLIITTSNTVVLGIGMATLTPIQGTDAIVVNDGVYGVRLCSFLVDAGVVYNQNSVLVRIGITSSTDNGSVTNPTFLHNVFVRVGGHYDSKTNTNPATVETMMEINQNYVFITNSWLWRADHDDDNHTGGLGINSAVCNHGLVVNGSNVTCYGLAVEHTLKTMIQWNGNFGRIYFLQSELPYEVSSPWSDTTLTPPEDYVSLELGPLVTDFIGEGIGVYCYFSKNTVNVQAGIKIKNRGNNIVFRNAFTVFLSGLGSIENVISIVNPDRTIDFIGNSVNNKFQDKARYAQYNSVVNNNSNYMLQNVYSRYKKYKVL